MKVKELIAKLQTFDQELEVTITDGYRCVFYGKQEDGLDFDVQEVHDFCEDSDTPVIVVDIGVGGCEL